MRVARTERGALVPTLHRETFRGGRRGSLNLKAADNGRTSSDLLSVCLTLHSDTYLISHPPTSPRERQVVSYSHVYMCVSAVIT